ncbi:hypothetical protein [Holophaga foetida]|uniref:hypothetical protein n=1 Tax=Holophaga foetida TaxID=35839 RepID=UPI0011DDC6C3|nr:hypothetical protein [Holophaga foetida]
MARTRASASLSLAEPAPGAQVDFFDRCPSPASVDETAFASFLEESAIHRPELNDYLFFCLRMRIRAALQGPHINGTPQQLMIIKSKYMIIIQLR